MMKFSWEELAFVDALITYELIDSPSITSHKVFTPIVIPNVQESLLYRYLKNDYSWCLDRFEFRPFQMNYKSDARSFTSFGLFAKTDLKSGERLSDVRGFLAYLPNSSVIPGVNDFSNISGHFSGSKNMLMLGPISFVNASCRSNTQYVYNRKRKVMELMTLEDIPLGTEITVDYGPTFFGKNREFCECPFDELHSRQLPVSNSTHKPKRPVAKNPKLNAQSTPNLRSSYDNQSSFDALNDLMPYSRSRITVPYRPRYCRKVFAGNLPLDCSSSSDESVCPIVSTPKHEISFASVDAPSCSTINCDVTMDSDTLAGEDPSTDSSVEDTEMLCNLSSLSVDDFKDLFRNMQAEFGVSDRCSKEILRIFSFALPAKNNLPSFWKMLQEEKDEASTMCEKFELSNGILITFDVKKQVESILNYHGMDALSVKHDRFKDMRLPDRMNDRVMVCFVLNVDGATPMKSTSKFHIWPMWLMIANLPIAVRQSYPNMTLAALYAGSQKPIWSEVDKVLDLSVINRAHDLNIRGQVVHTDFKLIYLVADMVAKASILNHMQFNGRFGCPLCYCQGQSGDDGNGWFYPLCTTLDLRSRISYLEDIRIAEESRQTYRPILDINFCKYDKIVEI